MRIPISVPSLRRVIASKAYWSPASLERAGLSAWVGQGFQALEEADRSGSSTVFVRAYQRRQDGKMVSVSAHRRGAPPRGDVTVFSAMGADQGESEAPGLLNAQWFLPRAPSGLGARTPFQPSPPGTPMVRPRNWTGRDKANDVPSWARGDRPRVGETRTQFAERLMDRQFQGRSNWDRLPADRGPGSAFHKIQKSWRGWRDPRDPASIILPPEA